MLLSTLTTLFTRDLNKLKKEINAYPDEKILWVVDKNITNSAGNLCLHLIGNINAFIGAELGNTGYIRQRDLEFSQKNVPREEMLKMIDDTIGMVDATFSALKMEDLTKEYPIDVFKHKMSVEFFLVHLISHLNYHLGQVNYHRRLLAD